MTRHALLALLLGAGGIGCATAATPTAAEAQLTWRLGFGGGGPLETGYGLAVGYRSPHLEGLSGQVLELDVSSRGALARLAGVPLTTRSYHADQNDLDASLDEPATKPWYSRQWVWWTIGGIASTVALSGASFGSSDEGDGGTLIVSGGPSGCSGGGNIGPQELPETCTPPTEGGTVVGTDDDGNVCVIEGFGNPEDVCAPTGGFIGRLGSRFVNRADDARLDAGTGGMGDLVAR